MTIQNINNRVRLPENPKVNNAGQPNTDYKKTKHSDRFYKKY